MEVIIEDTGEDQATRGVSYMSEKEPAEESKEEAKAKTKKTPRKTKREWGQPERLDPKLHKSLFS